MNGNYAGPERREHPPVTPDSFRAKIFGQDISVTGQFTIVVVLMLVAIASTIWMSIEAEQVRRVVEQEARLEVATIKARDDLILQAVARYCGVPDLTDELKRLEIEYKVRRGYINELRDKLGIPRIGPPPVQSPQQ